MWTEDASVVATVQIGYYWKVGTQHLHLMSHIVIVITLNHLSHVDIEWSLSSVYSFMFFQAHSVGNWIVFSTLGILSYSSKLLPFSKLSSQRGQLNGFHTAVYYFMFFHAQLSLQCGQPNGFSPLCILSFSSKLPTWATERFITAVYYFMFFQPFLFYQGILLPATHSFILLLKLCWLLIFLNSSGNIFHSFADV